MYYTKDSGGRKLLYLEGATKLFAKVRLIPQSSLLDSCLYSYNNIVPFGWHTYFHIDFRGYSSIEHVKALTKFIDDQKFEPYISWIVKNGRAEFYLNDDQNHIDVVGQATFDKNNFDYTVWTASYKIPIVIKLDDYLATFKVDYNKNLTWGHYAVTKYIKNSLRVKK